MSKIMSALRWAAISKVARERLADWLDTVSERARNAAERIRPRSPYQSLSPLMASALRLQTKRLIEQSLKSNAVLKSLKERAHG